MYAGTPKGLKTPHKSSILCALRHGAPQGGQRLQGPSNPPGAGRQCCNSLVFSISSSLDYTIRHIGGVPGGSVVKNLPAMQETQV